MERNEKARELVNRARGYWSALSARVADRARAARLVERAQEAHLVERANEARQQGQVQAARLLKRAKDAHIMERARAAPQQVKQLAEMARRLRETKQASAEWVDRKVKEEMEAVEEERSHKAKGEGQGSS